MMGFGKIEGRNIFFIFIIFERKNNIKIIVVSLLEMNQTIPIILLYRYKKNFRLYLL